MDKIKLDISQITPGMKLAEPVTNSAGITLMPAGIRLTPLFINRLQKWNIASLDVYVEKTQTTTSASSRGRKPSLTSANLTAEQEEFARSIASEVAAWFVNVREDPLMVQLRNVVIKRLIGHGRNGMLNRMRHATDGAGEDDA